MVEIRQVLVASHYDDKAHFKQVNVGGDVVDFDVVVLDVLRVICVVVHTLIVYDRTQTVKWVSRI